MNADSAGTPSSSAAGPKFDKREQLIEVSVFLFLIGPSLILSLFLVNQGNVSFMLTAVATILRDLSFLSLILFFLWRNGEPVLNIGWTLRDARRDILLGCALFVPVFFGAAALDSILSTVGFSSPSTPLPSLQPSRNALQMVTAVVLVAIVAVAEETIFRGYLMLRFDVFGSSTLTVLLSAFVFSLGHGYEGSAGVITVGALGAAFSLVYLWRGSLIAPITMHFLQDFVSIVFVPLLAGK
jgi:membrane protease YdiL (CAAX protease family)